MNVIDGNMKQPELGKKILELRQSRGLTQSELAENCNLSLRTVQRIESAEVTPRGYTVKVLFSYMGCDSEPSMNSHSKVFIKYLSEFFNLKKNTMQKLSVLALVAILATAGLFLAKSDLKAQNQKIEGWFLTGSKPGSYKIGLDKTVYKTGGSSAFMESTEKEINGFGTLMQTCLADDYLGKRIKMTAYVKSNDVSGWAGMWLRVDPKERGNPLSFDNMQDRPIKGTNDWTKCEIILDVPEESGTLNFGVLLNGTGKIWFGNVSFEIVDKIEKETGSRSSTLNKPTNLDFK